MTTELDPNAEITLTSCDGQDFKIIVKVAQMSETVKNLIQG